MALPQDHISMALFCDFENVALGVRDANYEKFDIKKVLERLLLKGSIVVKKSYCDWERYKGFKAAMHEANFELIEIPHVRQSGKNSADIRLVVDALDLCYTKSHVNTFVIISGDSDFSPLVSKLRENAKYVIGVGVKQSTSDLLIANCDEFIFYDDLVRDSQRQRKDNRDQPQQRRSPEEEKRRRDEMDARRTKAIEAAVETYEALVTDRDEGGRIWASVLKEAIKRRNPGFNENYYGYRTFGNLLEDARQRGLLDVGRDDNNSSYVSRGSGVPMRSDASASSQADMQSRQDHYAMAEPVGPNGGTHAAPNAQAETQEAPAGKPRRERGRQGSRRHGADARAEAPSFQPSENDFDAPSTEQTEAVAEAHEAPTSDKPAPRGRSRQRTEGASTPEARPASKRARGRGTSKAAVTAGDEAATTPPAKEPAPASVASTEEASGTNSSTDADPASAKSASRNRRPRRPAARKVSKSDTSDQG
jgi:uncharacterized LabA/DUF88 family protein